MRKFFCFAIICIIACQSLSEARINSVVQQPTLVSSHQRQPDSLFNSLPNLKELTNMIYNSNQSSLEGVIERLYKENEKISCRNKVLYFNEMIGMINVGLTKRNLQLNQLNKIYEQTKDKVYQLKLENNKLQRQAEKIGIFQINDKLGETLVQLSDVYKYYDELEQELEPIHETIKIHQETISNYTQKADAKRKIVAKNSIILIDLNDSIEELEEQLNILKVRKQILTKQIAKNKLAVKFYEQKIQKARQEIRKFEIEIQKILDRLDEVKGNSILLKMDAENLQKEANENYEDAILLQIFQNKKKIQALQETISRKHHLENWIIKMKKQLPVLDKENKNYYYYCFDQYLYRNLKNNKGYLVDGMRLPFFLTNIYGSSLSLPSAYPGFDKDFYKVNIFGTEWMNDYGYPFYDYEFTENNLFLKDDFTCLNPSAAISGNGVIVKVHSNFIQIKTIRGQYINLKLGACSRVQVENRKFKSGQAIYYNGVRVKKGIVGLYFASCF